MGRQRADSVVSSRFEQVDSLCLWQIRLTRRHLNPLAKAESVPQAEDMLAADPAS